MSAVSVAWIVGVLILTCVYAGLCVLENSIKKRIKRWEDKDVD